MIPAPSRCAVPALLTAAIAVAAVFSPVGCVAQTQERDIGIEAFRRGIELHDESRDSAALVAYRAAAAYLPDVGGWVRLYAAEAAAGLGDTAAVREYLAQVTDPELAREWGWRHDLRARLVAGDTAAALGAARSAAAVLDDTEDRAAARYRIAHIALTRADSASAYELLRAIIDEAPYTLAAVNAARTLTGLPSLSTEDHLRIGRTYLRHGNAERGASGIEAYLAQANVDPAERARLRFRIGRAFYRAGRYAEAERVLLDVVNAGRLAAERAARALYMAGRAQYRLGRGTDGRASFARTAERFPNTEAATEALFLAADLNHDLGRLDSARHYYRRAMESRPDSYYAGLAAMRLSGIAFLGGDYGQALAILNDYRRQYPNGRRYSKATYWSARAYHSLGDTTRARARLIELRQKDPLSYYGLLAADRLGREFMNIPTEPAPPADPDAAAQAERVLDPVLILREIGVDSAVAFELDRVLDSYENAATPKAALYELAAALNRGGFTYHGIMLGWRIHDRSDAWTQRLLQIIYPFPYERAVRDAARRRGLDPYLVAGLIRQESMFNADVYSSAGAVGLMQIMPATGRMLARAVDVEAFTVAMLERPEFNIRLGTRYLDLMLTRFDGNLTAVLAAYNAGPYQVNEWKDLPEFGREELFAERIPYRETRHYVKAVQRNARVYRVLYDAAGRTATPANH